MAHLNAIIMTGKRVGSLVVIKESGRTFDKHIAWECLCDCGKTKIISSNSLRRKNPVQSCGCTSGKIAAMKRSKNGAWNEGKSYSIRNGEHCYKTRHGWAIAALRHYGNKCQLCGWDKAKCDVHHKIPKSTGGLHTIENAKVVCPNCHRMEHEKCAI